MVHLGHSPERRDEGDAQPKRKKTLDAISSTYFTGFTSSDVHPSPLYHQDVAKGPLQRCARRAASAAAAAAAAAVASSFATAMWHHISSSISQRLTLEES